MVSALGFAQSVLGALPFVSAPELAARCASFELQPSASELPAQTTLSKATFYEAGASVHLASGNGDIDATDLPAFCRLELTLTTNATSGSSTQTELWLPHSSDWSGRTLGVGNGGFSGGVVYPALAYDGLARGFATWSTDTGHKSGPLDGQWALGNDDAIVDFGWRAVHLSAVIAPLVTRSFYSVPFWRQTFRYWLGCSTGGAQGLKSVQAFPDDFDGVVVGSPASWMTHLQPWAIRQSLAIQPVWQRWRGSPQAFWRLVHGEVMRQCDHLDGLTDGVLENPRNCHFRPEALACRPGKSEGCLTSEELGALRTIYSDYTETNDNHVFSRSDHGGELSFHRGVLGANPIAFPLQYYKYILLNDTEWDYRTMSMDIMHFSDSLDPGALNAVDPNITAFAKKGGKLVHYFGWGDQNIPGGDSIHYHSQAAQHLRQTTSDLSVDDMYRLFPVPGMAHCHGGEGASAFGAAGQTAEGMPPSCSASTHDILLATVDWVEQGKAPVDIVATKWRENDAAKGVEFQRRLCMWPLRSVYNGGDASSADSFSCQL